MEKIIIETSKYLSKEVYGFCHAKYYRRGNPMSTTGFLTDLKNDISYVSPEMLAQAEQELADVLAADFLKLVDAFGPMTVCGIPRAKHEGYYRNDQMGLRRVISKVAQANPMLEDGTSYIFSENQEDKIEKKYISIGLTAFVVVILSALFVKFIFHGANINSTVKNFFKIACLYKT